MHLLATVFRRFLGAVTEKSSPSFIQKNPFELCTNGKEGVGRHTRTRAFPRRFKHTHKNTSDRVAGILHFGTASTQIGRNTKMLTAPLSGSRAPTYVRAHSHAALTTIPPAVTGHKLVRASGVEESRGPGRAARCVAMVPGTGEHGRGRGRKWRRAMQAEHDATTQGPRLSAPHGTLRHRKNKPASTYQFCVSTRCRTGGGDVGEPSGLYTAPRVREACMRASSSAGLDGGASSKLT